MTETYGQRVAQLREELGDTQEEFAERTGVPLRTLQDIENGKVTRPQRKTRQLLDAAFGLADLEPTFSNWPSDVDGFTKLLGAFLSALPEDRRTGFIDETIRRMGRWAAG